MCMGAGLESLQSAARSAARRERLDSADHEDEGYHSFRPQWMLKADALQASSDVEVEMRFMDGNASDVSDDDTSELLTGRQEILGKGLFFTPTALGYSNVHGTFLDASNSTSSRERPQVQHDSDLSTFIPGTTRQDKKNRTLASQSRTTRSCQMKKQSPGSIYPPSLEEVDDCSIQTTLRSMANIDRIHLVDSLMIQFSSFINRAITRSHAGTSTTSNSSQENTQAALEAPVRIVDGASQNQNRRRSK
ncbi:hypothetical protein F5B18DRAFT_611465 [Nemania serpens]|nr:hypothetical protein F5B18DRAFT_611465 [Nemania serpens]